MNDPTFPYRVALGLLALAVLAAIHTRRHPDNPTRLKEYAFLFGTTVLTMLYGLLHDRITYRLSPAYYTIYKGIAAEHFWPEVGRLALEASWTAGLAIGVVLLALGAARYRTRDLPA